MERASELHSIISRADFYFVFNQYIVGKGNCAQTAVDIYSFIKIKKGGKKGTFSGGRKRAGAQARVHVPDRCHLAFFASRRQYERNKKLPDCLRNATRLREALAMPSSSHRIIVR